LLLVKYVMVKPACLITTRVMYAGFLLFTVSITVSVNKFYHFAIVVIGIL